MKTLDLGHEKIGKLLLAFSIPCIVSMLINSVYNIVDQIFIGQGVGTLGNAATNVIFPLIIVCNAIAGLIGNGCAANLSLRLGEGNIEEAKRSIGSSVVALICVSILVALLGELFLPVLVNLCGCTENVYPYAMSYGRIILLGAPFMIIYSGLSSIIRADGSPKYAMFCLMVGAIINLILDPIFILDWGLNLGVAGGAWATIIGQAVSFIIAILYLRKIKSVKMEKKDYKITPTLKKNLSLGASSFITQMTVLLLFVVMNNLMTKYGVDSKFGSDIPLSVYGIISKVNSLYVSSILGIALGVQPIIGFNYGAGNYDRVRDALKRVMITGFIIGLTFNVLFQFFPEQVISFFISDTDPTYELFMEFAIDFSKIFLMLCALNAFEMCSSIVIQSLGNVKKATLVSFTRQIILFIPLALILTSKMGLYGALYAGPIADALCFIAVIFIFGSEYLKLKKLDRVDTPLEREKKVYKNKNSKVVVTIGREYGSGGRYVGNLLSDLLEVPLYDKEMIYLTSKESGLSPKYIEKNEQKKGNIGGNFYSNDDEIFIAESKIIKKLASDSCVIVGRCADYILRNEKNVFKVFLYSDEKNKIKRAVKYYGLDEKNALKEIQKVNREREKHYKYYTNTNWQDFSHYDLVLNVDTFGVEKTAEIIKDAIEKRNK